MKRVAIKNTIHTKHLKHKQQWLADVATLVSITFCIRKTMEK